MNEQQAKDLLQKQWPGADEALVGMIAEMDSLVKDPWIAATVSSEGPEKFKERMADMLSRHLEKVEHKTLASLAGHALAPIVFSVIRDMVKAIADKEKGGSSDKAS